MIEMTHESHMVVCSATMGLKSMEWNHWIEVRFYLLSYLAFFSWFPHYPAG
jgi:hypothetical protein